LYSALEQYIDYLEGVFYIRKIDEEQNMKLQEFIKQELGLQENNPEEAITTLSEKEIELSKAIEQIQQLKEKYQKKIILNYFEQVEEKLKNDFPKLKFVGDKFKLDKNVINAGVEFSIDNQYFSVLLECNDYSKTNIYYGIGRHFASENLLKDLQKTITKFIASADLFHKKYWNFDDDFWYAWHYTSVDNGYERLKNLLQQLLSNQNE